MLITSMSATKKITLCAALFAALAAPGIQAAVVTQTQNFSFSYGPTTIVNPASITLAPAGSFVLNANPFNSALGTLDSFTIEWSLTHNTSFSSGSTTGASGSASANTDTSFYLNNVSYNGVGGGNGNGIGPNSGPVAISYTVANNATFLVANAGVTYDPRLLSAVLGNAPVSVKWGGGMAFNGGGDFVNLTSTVTGSAKLTYNYTAVATPVPEPTESMLFGIGLLALASSVRRRWH